MFIFNVKRDGTHKSRLVARGDQQMPGTYQKDMVANTVHQHALMTCLSNCLNNNLAIIQLDISSAYLYADIDETLYIRAPPHMKLKNIVFQLKKSLYGLKQSGANWYNLIKKYLVNNVGMKEALGWPCVFTKRIDNKIMIICLFVDDMILFTNSEELSKNAIDTLKSKFKTKVINDGADPMNNKYDILGMEIEYIRSKSMKFGMQKSLAEKLPTLGINLSPMRKVPGTPGLIIEKDDSEFTDEEYLQKVKWMQQVIGLASYVGYKYRFDLLYYINTLARHTLYPNTKVITLAKKLIQFLWNTRN